MNVLCAVFYVSYLFLNELGIPPFLTVIQFYRNIDKKRVGKSPQEISPGRHTEMYLLALKEQDKTKMELPLNMVSIYRPLAAGLV